MADTRSVFTGSIPELYDRHLGPILFEPYAEVLSRRLHVRANGAILEIACGTGILTRQLLGALPANVRLVATDLNQPMVDYARASLGDATGIEWRQADCTALPFPDGSFDAVACQFGLMFPADKSTALKEADRVLLRGGLLVFNVWDSLAQNPLAQVMHDTMSSLFPDDPPGFFGAPYGFHDPELWVDLLTAHGFTDIEHDVVTLEARSPTAAQLAFGQIFGSPLSHEIRARSESLEPVVEAVSTALARLGGEAPFSSPMRALMVTARSG